MNLIKKRLRKIASEKQDFVETFLKLKKDYGEDKAFEVLWNVCDDSWGPIDDLNTIIDGSDAQFKEMIEDYAEENNMSKEEVVSLIKQKASGGKYFFYTHKWQEYYPDVVEELYTFSSFEELINALAKDPRFDINPDCVNSEYFNAVLERIL